MVYFFLALSLVNLFGDLGEVAKQEEQSAFGIRLETLPL